VRNAIWENYKYAWKAEKLGGEIDIVEANETAFSIKKSLIQRN